MIEKVEGPTPWVSPIVVTPKPKAPDRIRMCVDMRVANTAIERERHITPTVDDIVGQIHGSSVFFNTRQPLTPSKRNCSQHLHWPTLTCPNQQKS